MPALAFLAVAGLALLALLFVADTFLDNGPSPIVTSSRVGLPVRGPQDTIQVLTGTPAPAPDMTSQAVVAAQPKALAEAPPEHSHVTRPIDYRQNRLRDRFSISGQ
jgi:hypothetical protein